MLYQTEAKAQGWRAMAIFDDNRADALILIGRSSTQVRTGYVSSFMELLEEDERDHVSSISLQHWNGAPDSGRWVHQNTLKVPPKMRLSRVA